MRIVIIIHLLYETPRDLFIFVKRLCRHPNGNVSLQAVQISTVVLVKCRLCQSCNLRVVYCHANYRNCTPTVQSTTESPNLCTKSMRAPVMQRKSAICTDHYSGYSKMPFSSELSPWGGILIMLIIGIVHQQYEVPRHHPICVQRLWHSYGDISHSIIHPYSGCTKLPFSPSSPLGVVHYHAHYLTCTPTVCVVTALPSLCTKNLVPGQRRNSGSCIHPFRQYTKIRLALECSDLFGLLTWTILSHYTYCMSQNRFSQCMQWLCGHPFSNVSKQAVQTTTAVVPNVVCVIVVTWEGIMSCVL